MEREEGGENEQEQDGKGEVEKMNRRNWMEREKGGVNEQEQDGNGEGGGENELEQDGKDA